MPSYTLKVDIDVEFEVWMETIYPVYRKVLEKVAEAFNVRIKRVVVDKSQSGHVHVWVDIESDSEPSDVDLLRLQFFAGDDHRRTEYNIRRFKAYGERWRRYNILFSVKNHQKE